MDASLSSTGHLGPTNCVHIIMLGLPLFGATRQEMVPGAKSERENRLGTPRIRSKAPINSSNKESKVRLSSVTGPDRNSLTRLKFRQIGLDTRRLDSVPGPFVHAMTVCLLALCSKPHQGIFNSPFIIRLLGHGQSPWTVPGPPATWPSRLAPENPRPGPGAGS